jgi:hypothetical protein
MRHGPISNSPEDVRPAVEASRPQPGTESKSTILPQVGDVPSADLEPIGLKKRTQSERRRFWLRRLRAEGPGGVPLWAAHFRYGELPCILLVTDFFVLRAGQRGEERH